MAKTLFFIEALALVLIAIAFPIIATDAAAAFALPLAISLVLPLACTAAVWSPASILGALRAAFSAKGPNPGTERESARILDSLGGFSRAAAALGLLFSLAAVCRRIPLAGGIKVWAPLGAFLSAYALINAQLWRILAAVVDRLSGNRPVVALAGESKDEARQSFAAAYGLTPREWETASLIAGGLSYKETAYELGISIKTVKAHMSSVYEKTGAASNVALALKMRGQGASSTKVQ